MIKCANCGKQRARGKFCSECGSTEIIPEEKPKIKCAVCGRERARGKFCPGCGSDQIVKKPEALICAACGAKRMRGKFCAECGSTELSNDTSVISTPKSGAPESGHKQVMPTTQSAPRQPDPVSQYEPQSPIQVSQPEPLQQKPVPQPESQQTIPVTQAEPQQPIPVTQTEPAKATSAPQEETADTIPEPLPEAPIAPETLAIDSVFDLKKDSSTSEEKGGNRQAIHPVESETETLIESNSDYPGYSSDFSMGTQDYTRNPEASRQNYNSATHSGNINAARRVQSNIPQQEQSNVPRQAQGYTPRHEQNKVPRQAQSYAPRQEQSYVPQQNNSSAPNKNNNNAQRQEYNNTQQPYYNQSMDSAHNLKAGPYIEQRSYGQPQYSQRPGISAKLPVSDALKKCKIAFFILIVLEFIGVFLPLRSIGIDIDVLKSATPSTSAASVSGVIVAIAFFLLAILAALVFCCE